MLMKNPLMSNLSTKVSRLKLSLSEIMKFRARSMPKSVPLPIRQL